MLGAEARFLLDACPSAVLVLGPQGHVAFANRHACELFGAGCGIVGLPATELIPEWPLPAQGRARLLIRGGRERERFCDVRTSSSPGVEGPMQTVWIDRAARDPAAEQALIDADRRLRYMIEMLPQAVCVFDAEDRYVLWNQLYADLYADIAHHLRPGITFEEILRLSLASGSIQEVIPDPDDWLAERMATFRRQSSQEERRLGDGRWLRYDDRRTPDGGAIGIRIDITVLKQREAWLRQLFEANPMPMLLCDGQSLAILNANRAALQFYGFSEADFLTKTACDMHVPGELQEFAGRISRPEGDRDAKTVWRQRLADGQERHVLIYIRVLDKEADRQLLLTIADVTDRVQAETEARRLANHDVLTGLPNRMQFYDALDRALQPEAGARAVVYCLDLDGFKPVNDVFGHAAGDDVLTMVADRLRLAAQPNLVARLGGDEFAILGGADGALDTDLAERCIAAIRTPFIVKGLSICIGLSIGIAVADGARPDRDALVQAADSALYQAKAAGRNTWRTITGGQAAPVAYGPSQETGRATEVPRVARRSSLA